MHEVGDVTQRQDNNLGLTENVYYDNDYRLTSSTLNGTQNLAVTYDNTMGNITSRSDVAGGASWTYSTTQKHAVTQAGSSGYLYTYDANGNATARQGSSIEWSSYNYPTTVNAGSGSTAETVAFEYGPNRQRWQQSYTGNSTTETTDYIGGLLEFVSSAGVLNYRHYINAGGEQVAVYSRTSAGVNTLDYLLSDHQASVASITNSSGAQVAGESFTPFGNRRNPTTWSGADTNSDLTTIAGITRQGYTFQTALGLWMGMNHMNGRVQDAVTGRMLSADPHIPHKTNTQSYNRYSYVNNNPITYSDPSGFTPCWECKPVDGLGYWRFQQFDPGSLFSPPMGSVEGISGFDVSGCDGCSTGSNIDNGLTAEQETDTLATGGTATVSGDGKVTLTLQDGSSAQLSADGTPTQSLASAGDLQTIMVTASKIAQSITDSVTLAQAQIQDSLLSMQTFLSNTNQNFLDTNRPLTEPWHLGLEVATGSVTAQTLFGNSSATFADWVFSGFSPLPTGAPTYITSGPATFTAAETGIVSGFSTVVNFGLMTTSLEGGIFVGSAISAIPTGSGNTVRDSVTNGICYLASGC
jgi:RHS repeat-associated protein